ncbi:hypothetical protein HK405_001439, partial [Cladochytrium tenue]
SGRTSHVYRGHTGPVTAVEIVYATARDAGEGEDPVVEGLFTASWDKTIRRWDVQSRACVQVLTGHTDFVKCLLLSGPTLYSGSSDRSIRAWDAASGRTAATATWAGEHTRGIEALAAVVAAGAPPAAPGGDGDGVDHDGWALLSASSDGSVRRWDQRGRCRAVWSAHLTSVYAVVWAAAADTGDCDDPDEVWTASADMTVRRWNFKTGESDVSLAHPDFVKCVAVLPGGLLVTGGRDENLRVWDVA